MTGTPQQGQFWQEVVEVLKSYNLFLIALLYPLNKAIIQYFEYKKQKDKEAIKDVVVDAITPFQNEMRAELKEIKASQESDRLQFNRDIKELLREIKR